MDATSACSFFDIILGLFIEYRSGRRDGGTDVPPPKLVGQWIYLGQFFHTKVIQFSS